MAIACASAVAASDVGNIPEAVTDRLTVSLRHYNPTIPPAANGLAEALNTVVANPGTAERCDQAGRQRCSGEFFWARIAEQTAFGSTGISS